MKLRKRKLISYFEPQEPPLDEYVYCDLCASPVYEYCSIHGPLLVIPDDKVADNATNDVPRAALTIPKVFLHIAPSIIPGAGLGVFSTLTLPCGVRFGPYIGIHKDNVESNYSWQLYNDFRRKSGVIDAADASCSNWMRYVNCSRHWREQNLVAYQYQGQIYYRTIKIIPRFTELLVFYGGEFARQLGISLKYYNSEQHFNKLKESKNNHPFINEIEPSTLNEFNKHSDTGNATLDTIQDFVMLDDNKYLDEFAQLEENITNFPLDIQANETNACIKTYNVNLSVTKERNIDSDITNKVFNNRLISEEISSDNNLPLTAIESEINTTPDPNNINSHHECMQCNFITNNKRNLLRHILSQHQAKTVKCDICNKCFVNKEGLKIHKYTAHLKEVDINIKKAILSDSKDFDGIHVCTHCDFITSNAKYLKDHCRNIHERKNEKCDLCDKCFVNKEGLKTHKYTAHLKKVDVDIKKAILSDSKDFDGIHVCTHCDFITSNAKYLKDHCRNIHARKNEKCDLCDKCFVNKEGLKIHKYTAHLKEADYETKKVIILNSIKSKDCYRCLHCDYITGSNANLKRHIRNTHKTKTVRCDICNKCFVNREGLKTHKYTAHLKKVDIDIKKAILSDSKDFDGIHVCTYCDFITSNAKYLKDHCRNIHAKKNEKCDLCDKCFVNKEGLKAHIYSVHLKEADYETKEDIMLNSIKSANCYRCVHCEYVTGSNANLKRHIGSIHKTKTVQCDICEKYFVNQDGVRIHKYIVHTKDEGYEIKK